MTYWLSCIERGRYAWAAWLPVLAACSFVLLVGVNISGLSESPAMFFSFGNSLSPLELVLLFVCSPLFFTRFANLYGVALTVFLCERLLFAREALSCAQTILLAQTTILAVLADRMPWTQGAFSKNHNARLKETLLQILVVFSLITALYALMHLKLWQMWLFRQYGLNMSQAQAFISLFGLIGLWLLASLNYLRSMALVLAAVPTLVVSTYALGLPISVLVAPFVLSLALSLTQIRRRYIVHG